jgi:hypothetical protein
MSVVHHKNAAHLQQYLARQSRSATSSAFENLVNAACQPGIDLADTIKAVARAHPAEARAHERGDGLPTPLMRPASRSTGHDADPASGRLLELAQRIAAERRIDLRDAICVVGAERPDLVAAYGQAFNCGERG